MRISIRVQSVIFLWFSCLNHAFANNDISKSEPVGFVENKGQVYDQAFGKRPDVLYSGISQGISFHLKNNGVSYQLTRIDSWKQEDELYAKRPAKIVDQLSIYRLDIAWPGISETFEMAEDKKIDGYSNYYFENCPNGVLDVKSFTGVTYRNLYSGIDLHYYSKDGSLKYDYLVAPGADYRQIKLEVSGANNC